MAADILYELYGSGAPPSTAGGAVTAREDNREEDVRFWDAARDILDRRYPYPPVLVTKWPN